MAVAMEGATVVREHQGIYCNVLVYRQRCDACGYGAPTNSFAVASLPHDTYDIGGFPCPCCDKHQAVRVRLGLGEEVAAFLPTDE